MHGSLRIAFLWCILFGSGFEAHCRLRDPISPAEAQIRKAMLNHVPWKIGDYMDEQPAGGTWSCLRSDITIAHFDPVLQSREQFTFRLVMPRSATAAVPAVIIIPTIEGVTPLENSLSSSYCKQKIAAVVADVNVTELPADLPAWGAEDQNDIRAIHRLRAIADFLQTDSRINGQQMGTIGLSLGGITASLFAAADARLQSAVITVGGGNLPAILTESDAKQVIRIRDARLSAGTITSLADYEENLHRSIVIDPIYMGSFIGESRVMMVIADNDTKVPSKHQWALREQIGQPETLQYSGSHLWTLIDIVFRSADKVINFAKTKWGMPIQIWKQEAPMNMILSMKGLPQY